jgi:hydrogenase expression/formation protein HypE
MSTAFVCNVPLEDMQRGRGKVRDATITMAHGSGGKAMRDLIQDVFLGAFNNPLLAPLEDQAVISLADLAAGGDRLAFTTDTYVVHPLFFPGGDIGTLAVNGTVNDLAMSGARPLYLSCGVVLEEGLEVETLRRVAASMRAAADEAGVFVVTGDTKVVERGSADKLFINTAGIGVVPAGVNISASRARPGDKVIVNGYLGDHGCAILLARNELALETDVLTDCQPLHRLVQAMLAVCPDIHCLRDATRGGLATVLNEFAQSSRVAIRINETALPLRETVRGACEILGLDPLYLANEGKLVAVVPAADAETLIEAMQAHPAGREAAIVGDVMEAPAGVVMLNTGFGGGRIVDLLVGEQLPRIC